MSTKLGWHKWFLFGFSLSFLFQSDFSLYVSILSIDLKYLPVSRITNLLSSNSRSAWAFESTLRKRGDNDINLDFCSGRMESHQKRNDHMLCEKNTLQSKNPFVDSDLSFLKALPILHGTWHQGSIKSTKSLQNPPSLKSLKSNFHLKVDRSIGESECSRPCFKNCLRRHFSLVMPQIVLLSTLLDFRFSGPFQKILE